MLNFEEELKKFSPIMEVDDIDEELFREDFGSTERASRRRRREEEDEQSERR